MTDQGSNKPADHNRADDSIKAWGYWLQGFWFVRSIAGILAILAVVPEITNLNYNDVLKGLHSIVIGWNYWLTEAGKLIGRLPLIPAISADVANSLIITFVVLPDTIRILSQKKSAEILIHDRLSSPDGLEREETEDGFFDYIDQQHRKNTIITSLIAYPLYFITIYTMINIECTKIMIWSFSKFEILIVIIVVIWGLFITIVFSAFTFSLIRAYIAFLPMRAAFWSIIGAIVAIEVLYAIAGDDFANAWQRHVCIALEEPLNECLTEDIDASNQR